MAQLEAFEYPGLLLEMYPGDHSPPHFHVINDDWNIRVKFNLSKIRRELVWDSKYPEDLAECPLTGKQRKELLGLIETHLRDLNRQWKNLHPNRRGRDE